MTHKCVSCGICCSLFYINLSKDEYNSKFYKTIFSEIDNTLEFDVAKKCGANFLAKKNDGSCIYLENNLCGVHENRPKVCQKFFCQTKSKKYVNMVSVIKTKDIKKISAVKK